MPTAVLDVALVVVLKFARIRIQVLVKLTTYEAGLILLLSEEPYANFPLHRIIIPSPVAAVIVGLPTIGLYKGIVIYTNLVLPAINPAVSIPMVKDWPLL